MFILKYSLIETFMKMKSAFELIYLIHEVVWNKYDEIDMKEEYNKQSTKLNIILQKNIQENKTQNIVQ